MKFAGALILLMGFGLFSQSFAQTTTWKYVAGDNSGYMVQIITSGTSHDVTKVEIGKKGDAGWTGTEILKMDDYENYIRIKSSKTGRVYELNIDWYDGKLVKTLPDGSKKTFWLKTS